MLAGYLATTNITVWGHVHSFDAFVGAKGEKGVPVEHFMLYFPRSEVREL